MIRTVLTAATLLVAALPANAQRLDTRVVSAADNDGGVMCLGNANHGLQIFGSSTPSAKLFQNPVTPDPGLDVAIGFQFAPTPGTRFGVGAFLFGARVEFPKAPPTLAIAGARLLADGTDINFHPEIIPAAANPAVLYLSSPDDEGAALGELALRARWIDLELLDSHGTVLRTYRFDGARISDAAEVLSIVKFRCDGPTAD